MTTNTFFLGAYWKGRHDSLKECADRLSRTLCSLSALSRTFGNWYEQAPSREEAIARPVEIGNTTVLLNLLSKSTRCDSDGAVVMESGATLGLWNGGDMKKNATINIRCESLSKWIGNSVVLNFPEDLGEFERWEAMARLFADVCDVWHAESGRVATAVANEPIPNQPIRPRVYDWMLYYSRTTRSQFPALPSFAKVISSDPTQTIVVIQEEVPDIRNAEHLRQVAQVQAALNS